MKEIDIVVPWVDSSDPQWIQEFNRYAPQEKKKQDANPERYRDFGSGELKNLHHGRELSILSQTGKSRLG